MKLRTGQRLHNYHAIPSNVVVRTNSNGHEVYISGMTIDTITFKILGGGYYSKPYSKEIMLNFK